MLYRNKGTLLECLDRNKIAFPPILFPVANKRHFLPSVSFLAGSKTSAWLEDDYVTN